MGYLRLLLALTVSVFHLYSHAAPGSVAVFGFYTLSGFLITLTLDQVYRPLPNGRSRFFINRFLRIYPTYWFCLLIVIACTTDFPHTLADWLRQIVIFGAQPLYGTQPRLLVTSVWSLNIELAHYILIGMMLGFSRFTAGLWLLCAYPLAAYFAFNGDYEGIYHSFWGPSFCFAGGCFAYHCRAELEKYCLKNRWLVIALVMIGLGLATHKNLFNLLLCPIIFSYFIVCLHFRKTPPTRLENFCADLAYPVFLLHKPLSENLSLADPQNGFIFWLTYVALSAALATLMIVFVEKPIKILRGRIRHRAEPEL